MGNLDVEREKKTNFKIEKNFLSEWKRDKRGHWEKRQYKGGRFIQNEVRRRKHKGKRKEN